MWSPHRKRWISISDWAVGEPVQIAGGTAVVLKIEEAGEEPVFNLEVDADHCYRVGEQGILVHNASMKNWRPVHIEDSTSPGYQYVKDAAAYRGKSYNVALRVGKRNLGKVKYKTDTGNVKWYKPKTFVIGRGGLGNHAEAQIQLHLAKQTGYGCGLIVLELFTERYPCSTCSSHFLNDLGENNNKMEFVVYWLAPHGEDFESDPGGKELRDTYMGFNPSLFPWP